MTNFDNGLPPASTDMAGKCVSSVFINTDDAEEITQQSIQAVVLNTEEKENQAGASIKSIVFSTEPVGKNLVLFYL